MRRKILLNLTTVFVLSLMVSAQFTPDSAKASPEENTYSIFRSTNHTPKTDVVLKQGNQVILSSSSDTEIPIFSGPDASLKPMFSLLPGTILTLTHGPDSDKLLKSIIWWRVRGIGIEGWVLLQNSGSDGPNLKLSSADVLKDLANSFDKRVRKSPADGRALLLRGVVKYSQKDYVTAVADFEQAARSDAKNIYIPFYKGLAYLEQQLFDEATRAFSQAIALQPQNALLYYSRGRTYQDAPFDYDCYSGTGFRDVRVRSAISADYDTALRLQSQMAVVYNNLGVIAGDEYQTTRAIDEYRQAIRVDAFHTFAYSNLSIEYLDVDLDLALDYANKAIEIEPTLGVGYISRADVYYEQGKYASAMKDLDTAQRADPTQGYIYTLRAKILTAQDDFAGAVEAYRPALQYDATNACVFYNFGSFLDKDGQYENAIESYSRAIEMFPKFVAAYVNRSVAYEELGRYEDALADLGTLIGLNPGAAAAYHTRRARVYQRIPDFDQAIEEYSLAISFDPSDPDNFIERAYVYLLIDKEDLAIQDYSTALRLNPGDYKVAEYVGDYYYDHKLYERALYYYELFVTASPTRNTVIEQRVQELKIRFRPTPTPRSIPPVAPGQ